jgi:hypothetical protein
MVADKRHVIKNPTGLSAWRSFSRLFGVVEILYLLKHLCQASALFKAVISFVTSRSEAGEAPHAPVLAA